RRGDAPAQRPRRVRRAAVGTLQLQGGQRSRAVQLFRPRRPGGAGLLARAARMRRAPLAGLAAALCFAAAPLRAQTVEEVTMASPATGFPFVAAYVAEGLGLWDSHGLKVKSIVIAGIGSTNAVISGGAEFAQVSGLSLTRAAANGQRLVAIVNTTDK